MPAALFPSASSIVPRSPSPATSQQLRSCSCSRTAALFTFTHSVVPVRRCKSCSSSQRLWSVLPRRVTGAAAPATSPFFLAGATAATPLLRKQDATLLNQYCPLLRSRTSHSFHPEATLRGVITRIFKKKFEGSWTSWTDVDGDTRDMWFESFKASFKWFEQDEDKIRKSFNSRGSLAYKNVVFKVRKGEDKGEWIGQTLLDQLRAKWEDEDWQQKSIKTKKIGYLNMNIMYIVEDQYLQENMLRERGWRWTRNQHVSSFMSDFIGLRESQMSGLMRNKGKYLNVPITNC